MPIGLPPTRSEAPQRLRCKCSGFIERNELTMNPIASRAFIELPAEFFSFWKVIHRTNARSLTPSLALFAPTSTNFRLVFFLPIFPLSCSISIDDGFHEF